MAYVDSDVRSPSHLYDDLQALRGGLGGTRKLVGYVAEFGDCVEGDLAEFAHLNLEDVWLGKVSARHARVCVEQQFHNPRSRLFDAARNGEHRLHGFDENTRVSIAIHDLLVSVVNGLGKSNAKRYPMPGVQKEEKRLMAATVRDFDAAGFLRIINGG